MLTTWLTSSPTASPVRPAPSRAAARPPTSRPHAVLGSRIAHGSASFGPRRQRGRNVLFHLGAVDDDERVRACTRQQGDLRLGRGGERDDVTADVARQDARRRRGARGSGSRGRARPRPRWDSRPRPAPTGTSSASPWRRVSSAPRSTSRRTASSTCSSTVPSSSAVGALDLEHPHLTDVCPAAVLTPRARAEVGGGHRGDPVGVDRGSSFGIDLGRLGQPFCGRDDRRKLHDPLALAVVLLAQHLELALAEIEPLDAGGERQVEQLRHFRPDLAGVGVDGVAAGEHEVERPFALEHRRQARGRWRACRTRRTPDRSPARRGRRPTRWPRGARPPPRAVRA